MFGFRHDLGKALAHAALGRRHARTLHVRRVGKERQHASAAIVSQGVQVADAPVRWRGVELEIPRVNDDAERRRERERAGLNDAVGEVNHFDAKRADLERRAGVHFAQVDAFLETVFGQLGARQRQGEGRAVNGRVHLVQNVGERTDVVFVAVGEQNGAQTVLVLAQVSDIGNHDIHAQQLGVREHDAAIDHDHVVAALEGHHVHAELAQASEGYRSQLAVCG